MITKEEDGQVYYRNSAGERLSSIQYRLWTTCIWRCKLAFLLTTYNGLFHMFEVKTVTTDIEVCPISSAGTVSDL